MQPNSPRASLRCISVCAVFPVSRVARRNPPTFPHARRAQPCAFADDEVALPMPPRRGSMVLGGRSWIERAILDASRELWRARGGAAFLATRQITPQGRGQSVSVHRMKRDWFLACRLPQPRVSFPDFNQPRSFGVVPFPRRSRVPLTNRRKAASRSRALTPLRN